MYIGQDRSLGICFPKTISQIVSKLCFPPFPTRLRVGHNYILVLAFAANVTRDGTGGRPVRFGGKMAKLSKYFI